LGKKEIKLLIILGIILYAGLFFILFVQKYIPEINDQNGRLSELKEKKRILDEDLAKIDEYKSDLVSKTSSNERTENFIYLNADVTDCIDYVDKLELLMQNKLRDVSVLDPVLKNLEVVVVDEEKAKLLAEPLDEKKATGEGSSTETKKKEVPKGQAYIELGLEFSADLTYPEITQLLSFIEGSSKRIKVSRFEMEPKLDKADKKDKKPVANTKNQLYEVTATVNMYTINDNADKIYEYSRSKFNRYLEQKGITFGESIPAPTAAPKTTKTISFNTTSKSTKISGSVTKPDFYIGLDGVLSAGDNLKIYGVRDDKESLSSKIGGEIVIRLEINNYTYSITGPGNRGRETIRGSIPDRDLSMEIIAEIPNIKDNETIKLNVQVVNNSKHKITINKVDSGMRATIKDRSGNKIEGSSKKEKITIK